MSHNLKTGAVVVAGVLVGVLASAFILRDGRPPSSAPVNAALPAPFSRLLLSMYARDPQWGTNGVQYQLDTRAGITTADGAYIFDLCKKVKPRQTLEVGFAEGFSALHFLAAIKAIGGGFHVAIDPFENTSWHGLGLQKVQEAQMTDRFRFMEAKSIAAIPALTAEALSFEIMFIDGDHRFDAAFTDFVLCDAMCPRGGYILLHDLWMGSTKKVLRYLEKNRPDYARRQVPAGVNIAAFQKVGDDRRDWRHFVDF